VISQKINTNNRKIHIREQKCPFETAAMKRKLPPLLAPAHNMLSAGSRQVRPCGWSRGLVWEDAIAGAGIYEKTPARNLILNVDQAAGGDGVEAPPAA
jgi:hypothetical protein